MPDNCLQEYYHKLLYYQQIECNHETYGFAKREDATKSFLLEIDVVILILLFNVFKTFLCELMPMKHAD